MTGSLSWDLKCHRLVAQVADLLLQVEVSLMGQGVVQMRLIHEMQQDAMCKAAMARALIFAGGDSKEMGNALVQRLHALP